jgi:hypothetical protein
MGDLAYASIPNVCDVESPPLFSNTPSGAVPCGGDSVMGGHERDSHRQQIYVLFVRVVCRILGS